MRANIQWTVQANVRDGQFETAKALASEMTTATRNEDGCAQYEFFFAADGSTCHVLEEYADSDAAMVHLQNFLTNFVERFMGCLEPTAVYVYGSPSDALKEGMKPFGAQYLGFVDGFVK